jgi:endonuclease/exonuclease/phosphatase (EEP) superfamily protein YafD
MRVLDSRAVGLALLAAAAATIGASVVALAGDLWWGFELFAHFRVQYLAAQILLFLPLLAQWRLRWCFLLGVAAVLNAVPLVPYLPLARTAVADPAADTISVMAVNVMARNQRHQRLIEIIDEQSPDVLVVVELTDAWQQALQPLFRRYPHRLMLPEPDDGAFGIALLSRYRLDGARGIDLETTAAVDARVESPLGAFRLIGVHLRPPTSPAFAAERNRQLGALADLRRSIDEPLVVVGDFNVTPFSPWFANWLLETGLRDARSGRGPSISWPTFLPLLGIPIDHCVVSPEFTVVDFRRLPRFGSDHYPVLAELTLEQGS